MQTPLSQILEKKGTDIHNVTSDTSVTDAVRSMNSHGIGCLLVIDDGRTVGIFTERDVLTRVIEPGRDPSSTNVGEVMTTEPVSIDDQATLEEAMAVMRNRRFRHLVVTGQGGKLSGMVSINDLIGWLVEDRQHEIDQLVSYISGSY
ncbi:MAG: CBS domain-containing protein [Gammaproteobacteria bacterium]|nr:CBS domain-containing protein [Gammaproteobacteria bacterium]